MRQSLTRAQRCARRYHYCKEHRLCVDCGKPLPEEWGKIRCESCSEIRKAQMNDLRDRRRLAHKCGRCGREMPKDHFYTVCPVCRDKARAKREEAKANAQ